MIADLLGELIGSMFGSWSVERRREKKAAEARKTYGQGEPVTIFASVLGLGAFSSKWTSGVLEVEPGGLTWYGSHKRKGAGVRFESSDVRLGEIRDVGLKEAWTVNPSCRVLPITSGSRTVEFGVLHYDLPMVLAAIAGEETLDTA